MRSYLILNNFLLALVIASQSSFGAAHVPNAAAGSMTDCLETEHPLHGYNKRLAC